MKPQNQLQCNSLSSDKIQQIIRNLNRNEQVKGLKVPLKKINYYHKKLKELNLMYEPLNVQKIINFQDGKSHKIILMSADYSQQKLNLNEQEKQQIQVVTQLVTLTYENFSTQEIFDIFQNKQKQQNKKQTVPFPNSFQTAGHIAHYNLTPDQSKYLHLIGEITLLKCGNIKTVVNKSQKLHNVYRTPTLQHMAGQKNAYQVKMKEVGVTFEFDFEKVYWCSRLQKQRDRLLELIKPGHLLADIFCGVGPLAVRAARKGAFVIANDLNPYCHEYLNKNANINAVEERMICWNMCAREAIRKIYREHKSFEQHFREPDHIYMNLPVDAIEFLDVLSDYHKQMKTQKLPLVHVNCFVVADSDEKSKQLLSIRINKVLPNFKPEDIMIMHHIKNVTVIMRMYCVTFRLSKDYSIDQQQMKKQEQINKDNDEQQQQVLDKVEKKRKLD